ncbi:hypothetical protein GGR57DRAFT_506566 [Xylariaceae sp. FL1272]|nr:hypothetical protein GGR57DRAFT_506566 [Xylariaceae sp. FL1272]
MPPLATATATAAITSTSTSSFYLPLYLSVIAAAIAATPAIPSAEFEVARAAFRADREDDDKMYGFNSAATKLQNE